MIHDKENGILGSCEAYDTRKHVTKDVRRVKHGDVMSISKVVDRSVIWSPRGNFKKILSLEIYCLQYS